jgi:uncharacterized protein (TIGR02271 family)
MMNASSDKTVLGVFDDYRTAESAARELTNAGIPRESIEVKSNFMTGAAGRSTEKEERHEGGISGFFHRLFGGDSDDYGGHYAEAVRRGNSVVCVTAPENQVERIVDIMNSAGAVDIERHVENYRQGGYQRHDPNAAPYTHDEAIKERESFRGNESAALPVVEEELQIGKRAVQKGGVRVHSRVIEEPVNEGVELREEHVRVERRPADRPVSAKEQLRDQTIEVTETAEEPVVQKRARVREEVVVGKEVKTRTENIRDNVRRTEVDVEKMGAGNYSDDFRRDFDVRYGGSGEAYDDYAPAYEYGFRSASDPQRAGKGWSDVEQDLQTDYTRKYPKSSWDRMKGAVRYGWEKVTQKR